MVDIVNAISQSSSSIGRCAISRMAEYAALTAFNFTSRIVKEVVVRQPKDGLYAYTVNFKMAVTLSTVNDRGSEVANVSKLPLSS